MNKNDLHIKLLPLSNQVVERILAVNLTAYKFAVFISLNNIFLILTIISDQRNMCVPIKAMHTVSVSQRVLIKRIIYVSFYCALLERGNVKLISDNSDSVLSFKNRITDLSELINCFLCNGSLLKSFMYSIDRECVNQQCCGKWSTWLQR